MATAFIVGSNALNIPREAGAEPAGCTGRGGTDKDKDIAAAKCAVACPQNGCRETFLEAKDYWIATCICHPPGALNIYTISVRDDVSTCICNKILGGSIKYRESIGKGFNGQLRDVLSTLLKKPEEEAIETEENGQIELALNELDN
ncbi:MAG: hypothetical protein Q9203_005527 [Teloschistes exilis]